jgi:hypothetical protein
VILDPDRHLRNLFEHWGWYPEYCTRSVRAREVAFKRPCLYITGECNPESYQGAILTLRPTPMNV